MRQRRFRYNGAMDIEIRPMTPEHGDQFTRVMATAFGEEFTEEEVADHDRWFEYDRSIAAFDGDRIVGTVVAGWDGWRCHLYRLAVAPGHRRSGIGRALITAAEERFRVLGGSRVDAMVLDDNEQAHRIWRACGYRPHGEWSRWVKPL